MKFVHKTHVLLTIQGQSILGELFLASPNGLSLMVRFSVPVGPYGHLMPLIWTEEGCKDLTNGTKVEVLLLDEFTANSYFDMCDRIRNHVVNRVPNANNAARVLPMK